MASSSALGHIRLMKDCASPNIDPETVVQALRRLNRFHRTLFWAERYHELSYPEIAERLRVPEQRVSSQIRVMTARFILAADDVEVGRREGIAAKAKRLSDGLGWTMKLWAYRFASRSEW